MKKIHTIVFLFILINACSLLSADNKEHYKTILFKIVETKERLIIPGNAITEINTRKDHMIPGLWNISVKLNSVYTKKFEEYTSENVGRELEMFIGRTSLIKARIAEPITGGELIITSKNESENKRLLGKLITK